MESLRNTAVAKVVTTLSKYGRLHLSDLCRKSEVAYAHLYRVLPAIVRDKLAEAYVEKNRKYYRLTEKGRALARAFEHPEELPALSKSGETVKLEGRMKFEQKGKSEVAPDTYTQVGHLNELLGGAIHLRIFDKDEVRKLEEARKILSRKMKGRI